MEHKISISNQHESSLLVMLEPWGEDYWLHPKESFEIIAAEVQRDFYFHVTYEEKYIAVYVEGNCASVSVIQNGRLLECGHNRPENAF